MVAHIELFAVRISQNQYRSKNHTAIGWRGTTIVKPRYSAQSIGHLIFPFPLIDLF